MTKWKLFSILAGDGQIELNKVLKIGDIWWNDCKDIRFGILQSIERESGDGRSFNLQILISQNKTIKVYIRTID